MINVNVLYDGQYNDVDIIAIPSNIVENISDLAQEYLDWVPSDDFDGWVIINNKKCLSKGADGFVKWLNSVCCFDVKSYVVRKNVVFCPTYPTVEF